MARPRQAPKPKAPKASSASTKAVVLYSAIRYVDAEGEAQSADRGETVELTASEFKRLKDLDAVAAAKSSEAKEAQVVAEAEASPGSQPPTPVEPEPEPET
jgi:hypothetical protein